MGTFWDFNSWGFFNLVAVLLVSLLVFIYIIPARKK